ncbi:MAG: bacteriorhodopsin [Rhodospirillaceae bacterium]|nr:bacteriorhodopsin [Rhodospirillaceae bacterium]
MEAQVLQATDVTGGTFSLGLMGMVATTVLLLLGTAWVSRRWKLPVALAAVVTLVAAALYFQMRQVWLQSGQVPVIYRYVDWMITVPIQVLALYFFIGALARPPVGLFWRLLVVAVVMILTRYMGEVRFMNPTLGFLIGIAAWLYILGEVFFGRLGDISAKSGDDITQTAFFWLRLIVTIGWAVYPLCNFIASFAGGVDEGKLSIVYNLADFVNQIAFGLIILTAAVRHSAAVR